MSEMSSLIHLPKLNLPPPQIKHYNNTFLVNRNGPLKSHIWSLMGVISTKTVL